MELYIEVFDHCILKTFTDKCFNTFLNSKTETIRIAAVNLVLDLDCSVPILAARLSTVVQRQIRLT